MSLFPAKVPRPADPAVEPKALLQLSASRGKLALELAEPLRVGPVTVTRLVSSLDGLSFPVDLSGGVARFRHRRGTLDLMVVETQLAQLASVLTSKARAALDSPSLQLSLLPTDLGLTVGVHDDHKALAFSAFFTPEEHQLQFVVANARGIGFGYHTHATAIRLARALGGSAQGRGSVVVLDDALARLAREVLVDAGARLPACAGLHIAWAQTSDGIRLIASPSAIDDAPPAHVVRAVELARIAEQGDEALLADRLEDARTAYVAALEAAPRHPDLALRIAELDLLAQHTPESALASIVETMPALDGGIVGAELLAALGDRQAASVTLQNAAEREPFAPLAARLLTLAASHAQELHDQLALLDEALARSPASASIRWQRARTRLAAGRFTDAVADLGQLEAAARGSKDRFDACLHAGQMLLQARLPLDARTFFEKSLRYSPRSADASTGLARAFFALGDGRRGVALLSRATLLSQKAQAPQPSALLELAKALAEYTEDLPAAIFHARSVPFGIRETIAARALEARWRHQLDDVVGASHAFSQAREAAAQLPLAVVAEESSWLLEAALFELDVRNDARSAKRHAELALQATPSDPHVRQVFRRAARAEQASVQEPAATTPKASSAATTHDAARKVQPAHAPERTAAALDFHAPADMPRDRPVEDQDELAQSPRSAAAIPSDLFDEPEEDAVDEARIESLTDRVRANPADQHAVLELCTLLERAERHLDLMALVSARLEESTDPAFRSDLLATRRRVLQRLIRTCRDEGRADEAEMYEMVLADDEP
jgi:tetratricopeptide (TPR) repeat protein